MSARRACALAAALALNVGLLAVAARPAGAAAGDTTFVTVVRSPGAFSDTTPTQMFRPGNATISVSGTSSRFRIQAVGGTLGKSFTIDLQSADGAPLAVGDYLHARDYPGHDSAGRPRLTLTGESLYCPNESTGRFLVHDVAVGTDGVISRFWATYEFHCNDGPAANFGEIRFNEPGGDTDLLVANDRINWPDTHPGRNGVSTPVWLVNTSGAPVTVSGAVLGGTDAADFTVVSNGCSTIAAGATCALFVRFDPTAAGPRAAVLTVSDSTPAGTHLVDLLGNGIPGHTTFSVRSEKGDFVGQGKSADYTVANVEMWARARDTGHVEFGVIGGTLGWEGQLNAAPGGVLAPGTYANVRSPNNPGSSPSLFVSGAGGCSEIAGTFTVLEAAFTEGTGELERFSATFTQRCDGATAALHGWIAWRATDPNVPDAGPPGPVTSLKIYPQDSSLILTWANPTVADFAGVVVRGIEGLTAPATPTSGFAVYTGPDESAYLTGLDPSQSYAFSVWAKDTSANTSTPTRISVRGTGLSLGASPSTVNFGGASTVSVTLLDGATRKGLNERSVDIYVRKHGTIAFKYLGSVLTGSQGGASFPLKPGTNYDVKATFWGGNGYLGSTVGPIPVYVRSVVTATLSRTSVPRNGYATITGKVSPAKAGQIVYLQRYYGGAWHNVTTAKLSSASAYTFSVHPTAPGSWIYRVYKTADGDNVAGVSPTRTLTAT
jgi:hypothetical protein